MLGEVGEVNLIGHDLQIRVLWSTIVYNMNLKIIKVHTESKTQMNTSNYKSFPFTKFLIVELFIVRTLPCFENIYKTGNRNESIIW